MSPTEKQLRVISLIEKNIPYTKFIGKTKAEASSFISDNLEKSRVMSRKRNTVSHRPFRTYIRSEAAARLAEPDSTTSHKKSDKERYEEYINSVAGVYADCVGDGWGGFEAKEIARKVQPFDEWIEWH